MNLDDLERLARLRASGALTQEEFEAEKTRLFRAAQHQDRVAKPVASEERVQPLAPARGDGVEDDHERAEYDPGSSKRIALGVVASGLLILGAIVVWLNDGFGLWDISNESGPGGLPILDDVIHVGEPTSCEALLENVEIFEEISSLESITIPNLGTYDVEIRNPEPRLEMRFARVEGYWGGLRVNRLVHQGYDESDISWNEIRFLESPEKVSEVLRGKGFDITGIDETAEIDNPDAMTCYYGVETLPGGSAFSFGYG